MCEFETHRPAAWQFPCEVCDEFRPRHLIQITRHDVGAQFGLSPGSLERIVRHCCDSRDCIESAEDADNWRILDGEGEPLETFEWSEVE